VGIDTWLLVWQCNEHVHQCKGLSIHGANGVLGSCQSKNPNHKGFLLVAGLYQPDISQARKTIEEKEMRKLFTFKKGKQWLVNRFMP
jgi:hypothetical protein